MVPPPNGDKSTFKSLDQDLAGVRYTDNDSKDTVVRQCHGRKDKTRTSKSSFAVKKLRFAVKVRLDVKEAAVKVGFAVKDVHQRLGLPLAQASEALGHCIISILQIVSEAKTEIATPTFEIWRAKTPQ